MPIEVKFMDGWPQDDEDFTVGPGFTGMTRNNKDTGLVVYCEKKDDGGWVSFFLPSHEITTTNKREVYMPHGKDAIVGALVDLEKGSTANVTVDGKTIAEVKHVPSTKE